MKRDFRKLLAMLTEADVKQPELPFSVEKRDIEIPFIAKDGTLCQRAIRLYFPETAPRPLPLVFIAHYEMKENDVLLAMYLQKGWAVSTPIDYKTKYNGQLNEDNLIFNSAALSAVRKQEDIDRTRIVISGGSAGGYMTQMLSILHLGICCSVSFSGITNIMFNMRYMEAVNQYNAKALEKLSAEEQADFYRSLEAMPVPILGAVSNQFTPILEKINQDPHHVLWTASSPSCMADCFTNPIVFTHFTSDVLVPIDQLTRRFTYVEPGESLPADFRHRLSEFDLLDNLQYSLAEALPAEEVAENLYPAPQKAGENIEIPFDLQKRFNIVVFDEGSVEGDAGHSKNLELGSYDATIYMEAQLNRSSRETNWLTAGKLAILAERYTGKSVLLPGHSGADEKVYGSVAMHRQLVLEELADFAEEHQTETLDVFQETTKARPDLMDVLNEIKSQLF